MRDGGWWRRRRSAGVAGGWRKGGGWGWNERRDGGLRRGVFALCPTAPVRSGGLVVGGAGGAGGVRMGVGGRRRMCERHRLYDV